MALQEIDPFDELGNPLDSVEDLMNAHNWVFSRDHEDELHVQVTGRIGGIYDMQFVWQEEFCAMQLTCKMSDVIIDEAKLAATSQVMRKVNAHLWLGHFDFLDEERIPRFRHTCLFRGMHGASGAEHIEDLVDIALAECERFFAAFDLISRPRDADDQLFSLAMMDAQGDA
jgi:hypothetical protein